MECSIEHVKPKVVIVSCNNSLLSCRFLYPAVCFAIVCHLLHFGWLTIMFLQVCNAFSDIKNEDTVWWLEALHHAEQNKDFSNELIRKIEEAIAGSLKNRRSLRMSSWLVMILVFRIAFPEQCCEYLYIITYSFCSFNCNLNLPY